MVFAVSPGNTGPENAGAASFNRNLLISDAVFDATGTMTTAQIQAFLNRYPNSCLRNHRAPRPLDYSAYGADTSAAEVIRSSALLYGVNPQVLLVTLEKEQSLVTGSGGCTDWRYWSAMGYACPDGGSRYNYPALGITGTCVSAQQHAGFSAQVNHGAWQLQFNRQRAIGNLNWRDNQTVPNYGYYTKGYRQAYAGAPMIYYDGTATISGQSITMTNGPTATLYTYTPHVSANEAFVTIFTNWFGSPTGTPTTPTTVATTTSTTTTTVPAVDATAAATYTTSMYELFLGRSPDSAETRAWTEYLVGGRSRADMVRLILAVHEHSEAVVAEDYRRMFNRLVDPGGLQTWTGVLAKTGQNDRVLSGLAGSGEYDRRCGDGDNAEFVRCLYRDLLGRTVDPGGFRTWTHQLDTGQMSRRTVAERIVGSAEYSRYFVDQSYRLIFGRAVDDGGAKTWTRIFERARNETDVFDGLARSGEGWRVLSGSGG